jgi:hypothetical protein
MILGISGQMGNCQYLPLQLLNLIKTNLFRQMIKKKKNYFKCVCGAVAGLWPLGVFEWHVGAVRFAVVAGRLGITEFPCETYSVLSCFVEGGFVMLHLDRVLGWFGYPDSLAVWRFRALRTSRAIAIHINSCMFTLIGFTLIEFSHIALFMIEFSHITSFVHDRVQPFMIALIKSIIPDRTKLIGLQLANFKCCCSVAERIH